MKKLAELVIKYRWVIIVATVILAGVMGYFLKDLKINSDILTYLDQDNPRVLLFNKVGDKYGGNALAMVALETDDVFNYRTLSRINEITQKFKEMDEVSHVMSLTDILNIEMIEGGLEVGKLIDKHDIPKDLLELKKLRTYTLEKDMYRGSLVSGDGEITLIIARLKGNVDKIATGHKIKTIVREVGGTEEVYYGGIPFQMISLGEVIATDLKKLIPLVILLVVLMLYFSFRTLRGVLLPLGIVLISTVWTLGIMSLMGIPLTICSNGVPVLLIAIGSAYGIHLLSKYNEAALLGEDKIEVMKKVLDEVGVPILLAGITTMVGFLAFLSSNLSTLKDFGLFIAIGVAFAVVVSLTFLPAVLFVLKTKKVKLNHKGMEDDLLTGAMDKLATFVLENKKFILVGSGLVLVCFLFAIPHLRRETNMIEYFEKDLDIRVTEEMMQDRFGGSVPIQLVVEGDLKDPFVLKEIVKLEKYMEAQPNLNDPQSIADLICELNRVMNGYYTIPETREGVANLWFFIEGNEVLPQLINSEATEGLIQAKLGSVSITKIYEVVNAIDEYLEKELKTDRLKIRISTAPDKMAKELRKERLKQIVSKIKWDVQSRGVEEEISWSDIEKTIMPALSGKRYGFSVTSNWELEEKLKDYFYGDEVDIEIGQKEIINNIITDIRKKSRDDDPEEANIEAVLRGRIPQYLYEDDPKALEYMSESIAAIISEEKEQTRIEELLTALKPFFPSTLREDEGFLKDLRDDIVEMNEDLISVAASRFRDVSNEKDGDRVKQSIKQTGMPIIYTEIDRGIMRSQLFSLSVAIFLVFLLLTYKLRSFIGGLIAISPIIFTIMINFIVMVILKIPLDVVTVLIGGVVVGIGVDYTIHFIVRFKFEFKRCETESVALHKSLTTTGRAITANALSVMMGFLALVLSEVVLMSRFGFLTAFTMVVSALASLTLLPSLILITKARFMGDFDRLKAISNKLKGGG